MQACFKCMEWNLKSLIKLFSALLNLIWEANSNRMWRGNQRDFSIIIWTLILSRVRRTDSIRSLCFTGGDLFGIIVWGYDCEILWWLVCVWGGHKKSIDFRKRVVVCGKISEFVLYFSTRWVGGRCLLLGKLASKGRVRCAGGGRKCGIWAGRSEARLICWGEKDMNEFYCSSPAWLSLCDRRWPVRRMRNAVLWRRSLGIYRVWKLRAHLSR